jgi:hypothetical protein
VARYGIKTGERRGSGWLICRSYTSEIRLIHALVGCGILYTVYSDESAGGPDLRRKCIDIEQVF